VPTADTTTHRRRQTRRVPFAVAAGVTVAVLVAGCGGRSSTPGSSGGAGASSTGTTFVLATAAEPDTLNPVLGYGSDGASLVFDGLVARDAGNRLVPALASALPTVSGDGKTVTATMRPGVTFHDGSPLTAADVAFTYTSVLDPKVDSTLRSDLEMVDSVTAPDERTVVFRLKYPYAPFLQRLTLGIVPAKVLAGQDLNEAAFNTKPIGTGPYQVTAWTPGDKLTLTANPRYWAGTPKNAKVVVAFVPDDNARAQRVRTGEVDAAELPPKLATTFTDTKGLKVVKASSADYRGVMLPTKNPVTGDPAIRKALFLAVDRQQLINGVLSGAGEPAFTSVAPTSPFADPTAQGKATADVAGATAALDAAGWAAGADGVRARGGVKAAFTLMYPASDSLRKELALAVTADARKAGIQITPRGLTWDAIEPRMKTDALIMGWGSPYDPDFVNYKLFGSAFAEKGFFNPGSYLSPEADRALKAGRDSADPAARKAAYATFQQRLVNDVPWVFLVFLQHTYVVKDTVQGVTPRVEAHEHGVANSLWWNIGTWTRN
jgi:peptide/nickel transport system substrate-binding protein